MKAHYFIIFLFPLLILCNADAQCKTIGLDSANFVNTPWYDNNQFLTDFLSDRGYVGNGSNFRTECPGPRYQLPVRIVVFRNGNNDSNSSISQQNALDRLAEANLAFDAAGTGIHFYLREFEFIADNEAHNGIDGIIDLNGDPNFYSAIDMFRQYRLDGMINIYFVRNTDPGETDSGQAVTPFSNQVPIEFPGSEWSCWVRTHRGNGEIDPFDITNTLVHELGHVLGNSHTHHPGSINVGNLNFDNDNAEQSSCFQEVVSRTQETSCLANPSGLKCEINGDGLCDTPGDPNMSTERSGTVLLKGVSSSTCEYSVPNFDSKYEFDRNGVAWDPNERNIMAYSANICQDEFSNMQIAVMWNRIENRFMDYFEGDFTAPARICTSGGNVNFYNAPTGMNISWTATPVDLFDPSTRQGTGTSAFVKAASSASSGWGTISFHESNNCEFFSTSYDVWIGAPDVSNAYINGGGTLSWQASYGFSVGGEEQGASHFEWSVPFGWSVQAYGNKRSATITPTSTGNHTIHTRVYNNCGFSYVSTSVCVEGNGYSCNSNNPCTNNNSGLPCLNDGPHPQVVIGPELKELIIQLPGEKEYSSEEEYSSDYQTPLEIWEVKIFDLSGNEIRTFVTTRKERQLTISDLPTNIYIVKVWNSRSSITKKVVIN